ncbi:MAG: hypothetical protein ABI488_04495 [Polyangiaceae bacterium]
MGLLGGTRFKAGGSTQVISTGGKAELAGAGSALRGADAAVRAGALEPEPGGSGVL